MTIALRPEQLADPLVGRFTGEQWSALGDHLVPALATFLLEHADELTDEHSPAWGITTTGVATTVPSPRTVAAPVALPGGAK